MSVETQALDTAMLTGRHASPPHWVLQVYEAVALESMALSRLY